MTKRPFEQFERQYITRAEVLRALNEEKERALQQTMTGAQFDQQENLIMSTAMLLGAVVFVDKLKWRTGEPRSPAG